jgi:hypothetical protein
LVDRQGDIVLLLLGLAFLDPRMPARIRARD